MKRCTVAYENGDFDFDGNLLITEKERSYIANQVLRQLNTYEALALKWSTVGEEGSATICAQAEIKKNSPYRTFYAKADGTSWWNYPKLEEFMEGCVN